MSGNSLVVEQAPPLAPPTDHAAKIDADDMVDLDAGDSLLDQKPDDGKDITGDEPSSGEAEQEPEPAGDEQAVGEPEEEDDPDLAALAEASAEESTKRPSGSARLKAQLAAANAEIERLRRAQPQVDDASQLAAAVEKEIGPPPKEGDFQDYLAFQKAETAYEVMRGLVSREIKKAGEASRQASEARNSALVEDFRERAQAVRKVIKDFDAVVGAATVSPQHPDVVMAILESEKGPELSYYLSKNAAKVNELNGMPLRSALREIGRLEARLTPPPKRETKAPAPVAPIRGGTSQVKKPNLEDLPLGGGPGSFEEAYANLKAKRR